MVFCLHDIAIAVIGFGDNRFHPGFRAGRYLVHLPENVRKDGFLAVVNGDHLLGVIRVGGGLDGIDGKHLRPDGAEPDISSTSWDRLAFVVSICCW